VPLLTAEVAAMAESIQKTLYLVWVTEDGEVGGNTASLCQQDFQIFFDKEARDAYLNEFVEEEIEFADGDYRVYTAEVTDYRVVARTPDYRERDDVWIKKK
jgi:hypothetical protein